MLTAAVAVLGTPNCGEAAGLHGSPQLRRLRRYRLPTGGGNAGNASGGSTRPRLVPPVAQPSGSRQPSYAELLAERDWLIDQERQTESRLLRLRGELDDLGAEIASKVCGAREHDIDYRTFAGLEAILPRMARARVERGFIRGLFEAFRRDLDAATPSREDLRGRVAAPADPAAVAQLIVDSGAKARASNKSVDIGTGRRKPLKPDLPAKGTAACLILDAGERARGRVPDDDDAA